jgi:hypothetical protein
MATVNRLKLSRREGVIPAAVASSPASPTRTLRLAILAASSLLALAIAANAKADDQVVASDSTSTEACVETCLDTASAGSEGDAPAASGLTADNGETLDPATTDEGGAVPSGPDEVGPADDSPVTTDPSGDSEPPPPVTETLPEAPPPVEAPPVEAPPPVEVPPPVDITPATDVPAPAEVSPPAEVLPPTETTASVTPSDVVPQELAVGSTTLDPQAAPPRPSIVVIDGPVVGSIPINPLVLALQRPSAAQSSGRSSATPAPSSGGRSSSGWTPESPRLPFPPSGPSAPAPGVAASAGAPGAGTFFLGFAVLVAAMSVGVSVRLSRRQLPSVAVWRPVAFVSPTERPG